MKKNKKTISLLCALCLVFTVFVPSISLSADASAVNAGEYVYTFNVKVDNPCNSSSMDKDDVNVLYFDYYYITKNGYGEEKKETFDMSWDGGSNRNSDFLSKYFIRPNDNAYNTSFDVTLPGKLNRIYIMLNMDGGERLSFTVESVYCGDKRINSNTDYVSSAYYDSTATIYCSMEKSVIDETNSPYFKEHEEFDITGKTMSDIINNFDTAKDYAGDFRDQYNSVIDTSVLKDCIGSSDGDINQHYSHSDEESMYRYTFYFDVENPINLTNADYDEVETFYIQMKYKDKNGYGEQKSYTLDMSYSNDLKRNKNPDYLSYFERNDDNAYKTHFSVWVPGIITEVTSKLNMSGEKLTVNFEKITLGSISVNTDRDYVSSKYFDSDLKIPCSVPSSQIVLKNENLPETYGADLKDQYGSVVCEDLFNKASENPQRYLYHMQN